jgi:hypothetical protein
VRALKRDVTGILDFALDDGRSFSVERGRDALSIGLEDEFGSVKGLDDGLDFGGKPAYEEDDGLDGGFGDGGLDFGFGEDLPIGEQFSQDSRVPDDNGTSSLPLLIRFRGCIVTSSGGRSGHPRRRQNSTETKTPHRRLGNRNLKERLFI